MTDEIEREDEREAERRDSAERPKSRIFGRKLKLALVGIVALLIVGSPFWAPLITRRMKFFRVRRIEIVGARYVAPNDILGRLHLDTTKSIWDPTEPIEKRVISQPGIQAAVVTRKLPGTLVIEVTERTPVALVPANSGFRVYDARGVALPIDPTRVTVDAPVLMGPDTTMLRLLGQMRAAMPALYSRVSAMKRVGQGHDELLFELKDIPVRAMQDVTLDRLAEIEPVAADLNRKQLPATEIDLRYRDQVIARLR
ncbi:MAG TPA: FtsQ-type POTRA domain-containing protein [Gemmatimonadaceae bacterium]|jgi:cell division protein FtsQ